MSTLADFAPLGALLDYAVRGTFILLAALGATALMRGASASARHLVWLAALAALLLLPIARGFVPEWRVLPVPAAVLPVPSADAAPRAEAPSLAVRGQAAPLADAPAAIDRPVPRSYGFPADWRTLALVVWAAGAALFTLRLAYGLARVWWMERRATEMTDDEWVRLTDVLSRRLRLGRIVRLLREPGATVPMTWGVFHPVILLPGEADGWESERRRVVLAHELAHVRRWDALTQWIAHVAVALFWFNPLVWTAARKLREEREHACDDAVLEIGTAPADYANHLLTIVRSLGSAPGPAAALAMARRSQFEGRLLAILDNAVRRNGVSRAAALGTCGAALACLLPLAAMRPAERSAAAPVVQAEEKPGSAIGRLADRVSAAVQQVARSRDEVDAARAGAASSAEAVAQTLNAMLPEGGAGEAAASARLAASGTPVEMADLLRTLDTRRDPELYAEIIRAAEEIGSSTDRRVVLGRLLEKVDLSHDNVVAIIGATRSMESSSDKRLVLERSVRHRAFRANPMPHVFYEALRTFTSSTDQRVVLTTLLDARRLDSACLELLFQHLPRLDSDTDERVVLMRAMETQRIDGHARQAYVTAARDMVSDGDRTAALSALVDEEQSSAEAPRLRTETTSTRTETTSTESNRITRDSGNGESVWNSDIGLEVGGREVVIQAKDVVFGHGRWDVRRIRTGGSLLVQETRGGMVRRLRAVPGQDGRPVYTFSVDGRTRSFDPGARSWFEAVIREFTTD